MISWWPSLGSRTWPKSLRRMRQVWCGGVFINDENKESWVANYKARKKQELVFDEKNNIIPEKSWWALLAHLSSNSNCPGGFEILFILYKQTFTYHMIGKINNFNELFKFSFKKFPNWKPKTHIWKYQSQ